MAVQAKTNEQAQQELSTILTCLTILPMILPGLGVIIMAKFNTATLWLLDHGILEKSSRVIWELNNGIGLDLGRIFVLAGVSLLLCMALLSILKASLAADKQKKKTL